MALKTVVRENRSDLALKIDGLGPDGTEDGRIADPGITRAECRTTLAIAAARILSAISSALASNAERSAGLAKKSTAPSSNARKVVSAPSRVSDEIISTGSGRTLISLRKNSRSGC